MPEKQDSSTTPDHGIAPIDHVQAYFAIEKDTFVKKSGLQTITEEIRVSCKIQASYIFKQAIYSSRLYIQKSYMFQASYKSKTSYTNPSQLPPWAVPLSMPSSSYARLTPTAPMSTHRTTNHTPHDVDMDTLRCLVGDQAPHKADCRHCWSRYSGHIGRLSVCRSTSRVRWRSDGLFLWHLLRSWV